MAWRFKASKYKNSAPIVPKIEDCVRDLVVGSYQNYGNNIAASGKFMAFPIEHTGSACAVFKLDDSGRKPKTMPVIHAHTDTITDLAFSPFHDNLLATGSLDSMLKIWSVPEEGLKESLTNPECTFNHRQRRIENVGFHPIANCLLYSTASTTVHFWDLMTEKEIFSNNDHDDVIQSLSFKADGTVLATNCKDKMVRIVDPRNNVPIANCANSHQSIKDSRVVWLGDQPRILTTGFDANRMRQVIIRDLRNFSTPEKTLELDVSTGVLMPLFDADTNMLFLAGKGDNSISFMEVTDKDPFLIEGIRHTGEQTKGACLVPKRSLRVMDAEVNRVLQLTINSVIPIMYQVPRKSYRDFHSDIFPDTNGFRSDLLAQDWMEGKNCTLPKISLDPTKKENNNDANDAFFNSLEQIIENLKTVKTVEKEINGNKNNTQTQPKFKPPKEAAVTTTTTTDAKFENEFLEKFNSVRMQNHENGAKVNSVNNNDIRDDEKSKKEIPKPLPRKSISEQISFEEIIPKPKPRTSNCNNYKPRLGPKPFSLDSTDNSFDKVFAVPAVPKEIREAEKETAVDNSSEVQLRDQNENNNMESDQSDNFSRDEEQRKSIADRRKLYESRSQSITEEKKSSPVLSKRADTMKPESKNSSANEHGTKRTTTVFGKVSKFRHLKGVPAHKSFHIENLRNVSRQIPSESDVFCANHERVAVPISGAGGKIAVFELSKGGRLPDGVIPCLVNGINVMDFQWDPFDARTLVVACDDGRVKIWTIPEGGLNEPTNEPTHEFPAHSEKISFIKFHPLAKNILLTASYDMNIKIWDLSDMSEKICLKGHTDQIYCFAWSPCGKFGATVCKDGKIRIYNPRKSSNPVQEGIGAPIGTRGCRITYAINGEYLVLTGFDKVSERQVYVFKTSNLNDAIGMISLDVSPVILVPYYDEDSSTLFLSGKGDTIIYAYEVTEDAPYLCPLSHHRCPNIHQGLSFLSKNHVNVAIVEFAKCYRLTNNSIEPLSFTVPRIKTDYFQDDIFIPTRMLWEPTVTASEWLEMSDKQPSKVSLKPDDMEPLSSLNAKTSETKVIEVQSQQQTGNVSQWTDDEIKSKTSDLKKSVSDRMAVHSDVLEQDKMEGVDSSEWQE